MTQRYFRGFASILSAGALALLAAGCGQRAQDPAVAAKAATTGKALQAQAEASGIAAQQTKQGDELSKALERRAQVLSQQKGGQ